MFRDSREIVLIGRVDITGSIAGSGPWWSLVATGESMSTPLRASTTSCATMQKSVAARILFRIIAHFIGAQAYRNVGSDKRRWRKVRGTFASMLVLSTAQGPRVSSGACAVDFQKCPFLLSHLLSSQARILWLRPITPHGRLLSPHERHIAQLSVGGTGGGAATNIGEPRGDGIVTGRVSRGGGGGHTPGRGIGSRGRGH